MFTDISANSAPTNMRANRSRMTSLAGERSHASGVAAGCAYARDGRRMASGNIAVHLVVHEHAAVHLVVHEVRRARAVEELAGDRWLNAAVAAERRHLIEQVARMARTHWTPVRSV